MSNFGYNFWRKESLTTKDQVNKRWKEMSEWLEDSALDIFDRNGGRRKNDPA